MPAKVSKVGPGTLTINDQDTGLIDVSCQITSATVAWDKETDDSLYVLCGEEVPGATTYTATLSGTVLQDTAEESGLVRFSWDYKGTTVPFTFVPSTADGKAVTGNIIIDPVSVGGDVNANATSDFEWACVGEPTLGDAPTPPPETASAELIDA